MDECDTYSDDEDRVVPRCTELPGGDGCGCDCEVVARVRDVTKPKQEVQRTFMPAKLALARVFDGAPRPSNHVYQINEARFRGSSMHKVGFRY